MKASGVLVSTLLTIFLSILSEARSPNVILILTDDQAYGDAGFMGNPWIQTPFLDSLAGDGFVFTNLYVNPRCAASRAALMTGRYPERSGVFHVTAGAHIMGADEVTMAEMFRDAGYATGIVGKWHIGDHHPYLPNDQGFEHSLIHGGGAVGQISDHPDNYWDMTAPLDERQMCYFNPTLYRNRKPVQTSGYITEILTDEAIHFIDENHAERPFFLYFATNAPHDPFQVPEKYLDMYKELPAEAAPNKDNGTPSKLSDYEQAQYVYAMMTNLDDNLRRLADKVKAMGEWDNTIWVFLSDNGPAGYRFNNDLRGKKGMVYEGGVRSPAFLYHPSLHGGKRIDTPTAHFDLLPTLATMAGVKKPTKYPLDGKDLSPLLNGGTLPERSLFSRESSWMTLFHDSMVRRGPWKLVTRIEDNEPVFELFNLETDPGEMVNVATQFPERVKDLKQEIVSWYEDVRQSPNCRIHPIYVGTTVENPVRLSRHEMVDSYSRGWFSTAYLGYFPLDAQHSGNYTIKLIFDEPLPGPGFVEFSCGPEGRRIAIDDTSTSVVIIEKAYFPKGEANLQAWFQSEDEVVSPHFIEISSVQAQK